MRFGAFWRFPAKGRKVNPRTKSQLVVNPDLRASTNQDEVPEVSLERILEIWSKVNPGSSSEGQSRSQQKVNIVTHHQSLQISKGLH